MKQYLFTFLSALIIGFLLCNYFLKQYNDYDGIKVSNSMDELYFIQYGVYSSLDSLEDNTINLQNYVYNQEDSLYYVYVGITKEKENEDKIVEHYKKLGYKTIKKKYGISNKEFINLLNNYDKLLANTDDETVISSIINQVLMKYEEVVINGSEN